MRKLVLVCAALLLASPSAFADVAFGYVCQIWQRPALSGDPADVGSMTIDLRATSVCGGAQKLVKVCSLDDADPECAFGTRYTPGELHNIAQLSGVALANGMTATIMVANGHLAAQDFRVSR